MRRRRRLGSALFLLLVGLVLVIGFRRAWFQVSSSEDSTRDLIHVNLTLDRERFRSDAEKAIDETKSEFSQLWGSISRSGPNNSLHNNLPPG
jgi:hypothetical protein